jgi:hypothetical protein
VVRHSLFGIEPAKRLAREIQREDLHGNTCALSVLSVGAMRIP